MQTSSRLLDPRERTRPFSMSLSRWPRYVLGAAVFTVGFILSPLTWWNDLVVNLPIAWVLASLLPDTWFKPAFIASYWVTNIAGFLMMYSSRNIVRRRPPEPVSLKTICNLLLVTTIFTLLFLLLMTVGIIRPIDWVPING